MILRRDHGVRTGAIGHTQAGAEVVRVGDAVEYEHERRGAGGVDGIERVVERMALRDRLDARDHALVPVRAGEAAQAGVVAFDRLQPRGFDTGQELAHALVATCRVDMHFDDRLRRRLHTHADRMETEQDLARHASMLAAGRPPQCGRDTSHVNAIRAPISSGWWTM